ncbi:MAG: glycosyltransferase family 4 protein [Pseudomonadota bacterium]
MNDAQLNIKRVLLSAFACDPVFGSDEEVGWQWAKQLSSRGYDVTVITRGSHRKAIEQRVHETGECSQVRFEYVDLPWLHAMLRHINRRNHIYYYVWQWLAFLRARVLHRHAPFDLIHHVTWVSFRQPSFMGLVGVPFYFGPVAGGDQIPLGYTEEFSFKQRLIEWSRESLNALVRFDPLMYLTYASATKVFFTSAGHLRLVPRLARPKASIELAIGSEAAQSTLGVPERIDRVPDARLLFVGRCIGWKGMDFGLRAFQRVKMLRPEARLTVVGDGVDRPRWMAKAVELGIGDAIEWRGWQPKDQVLNLYNDFDVMFYPSLRDSGGFVVLEALQQGLPVVCFRLGGPGVVVDDSCGAAVVAGRDVDGTVTRFATAVVEVLDRRQEAPNLSEACRRRARVFTWDSLVSRIYGPDGEKI